MFSSRWLAVAAGGASIAALAIGRPSAIASITAADDDEQVEQLLRTAHRVAAEAKYAVLSTVDESGAPCARLIEPIVVDEEMEGVNFGTNGRSRKVEHFSRAVALTWTSALS